MGDWILQKVGKLIMGAVGIALMLAWWTFTGSDGSGGGRIADTLPAVVGAGGRVIEVDLETSEPLRMSASFECGEDDDPASSASGFESLEAGRHRFRFDVPGDCWYGVIEAGVDEPPVGARLAWNVTVDGELFQEEEQKLDAPLRPGYGFFLQTGWDDGTLDEMLAWRDE